MGYCMLSSKQATTIAVHLWETESNLLIIKWVDKLREQRLKLAEAVRDHNVRALQF